MTTPSVSSRRARRPPPSSSSSPPSASQPTCHGHTLRTSTAWPGTRRSRGCSPPAATMERSPSGSTNSPRGAEGLGRRGVAVLLLKPAAVTGKGMGVTNLCPTSPSAVWTPAFLQVNFVRPKSHSSSARSGGGGGAWRERGTLPLPAVCPINPCCQPKASRLFFLGRVEVPPPGLEGDGGGRPNREQVL